MKKAQISLGLPVLIVSGCGSQSSPDAPVVPAPVAVAPVVAPTPAMVIASLAATPTPLPPNPTASKATSKPGVSPRKFDARGDVAIMAGMVNNLIYNLDRASYKDDIPKLQLRLAALRRQDPQSCPPTVDPARWPAIIGDAKFQKSLELLDRAAVAKSDAELGVNPGPFSASYYTNQAELLMCNHDNFPPYIHHHN